MSSIYSVNQCNCAKSDWNSEFPLHWIVVYTKICVQADVAKVCPSIQPKHGRIQFCLRQKRLRLSWDCQEQLFRAEVDNMDDVRLQTRIFNICLPDKKKVRTGG